MKIFESYPEKETLLEDNTLEYNVHKVNGHFHTPYSFSAFQSIPEVLEKAKAENLKILGINDFYVTHGYQEFTENCLQEKVFPLFNIEFIALSKELQQNGIRVNDPNNPGRVYFSGKGLSNPPELIPENQKLLESVIAESQRQVVQMVEKTNAILKNSNAPFSFTYESIKNSFAEELVRERHIAKAIRVEVFNAFENEEDRKKLLRDIYGGKETAVDISNIAALENEIRGNLLKAGGGAFVPEDDKAFLSLDQVIEIIIDAGGIPCYPVLLDDKNGNFTDFEGDWPKMHEFLQKYKIHCLELIPGRNSLEILKEFVAFFDSRGYVLNFGTEHNSPAMEPLTVSCRNGILLDEELLRVSFEGACVIAAHQYLKARKEEGFVIKKGYTAYRSKAAFVKLGQKVIEYFLNN